jgi:hypothetical protein
MKFRPDKKKVWERVLFICPVYCISKLKTQYFRLENHKNAHFRALRKVQITMCFKNDLSSAQYF